MKKYVFRKNNEGFHDWIRTVCRARNEISSYKTLVLAELKYSPDRLFRLKEAKRVYGNYMKLRSKLNDDQKKYLEIKVRHHVPPYGFCTYQEIVDIYEKWESIEFPNDSQPLKEYSALDIGAYIKKARIEDGRTKREVAVLLGISENTYKCYEEGRRMIPADKWLMILELFGIELEKNGN